MRNEYEEEERERAKKGYPLNAVRELVGAMFREQKRYRPEEWAESRRKLTEDRRRLSPYYLAIQKKSRWFAYVVLRLGDNTGWVVPKQVDVSRLPPGFSGMFDANEHCLVIVGRAARLGDVDGYIKALRKCRLDFDLLATDRTDVTLDAVIETAEEMVKEKNP